MLKYLKKLFITLVLATSRAEKKNIKIDTQESLVQEETGKFQSDFMNALMRGEFHQQYVQKFYQILKRSDEVLLEGDSETKAKDLGVHLIELDEKDKNFSTDFSIDLGKLDKNHKHYGKNLKEISKKIIKEKSLVKDGMKVIDFYEKYLIPKGDTDDLVLNQNGEVDVLKMGASDYNIEIEQRNTEYRFVDFIEYIIVKHNKNMGDVYYIDVYMAKRNLYFNEEEDSYKSFITTDKITHTNNYAVKHIYKNMCFRNMTTFENYFCFSFDGDMEIIDEVQEKLDKNAKNI